MQTAPLVDYYRLHGALKAVDGMAPIAEVAGAIDRALGGLPKRAARKRTAPKAPAAKRKVSAKTADKKPARRRPAPVSAARGSDRKVASRGRSTLRTTKSRGG